MMRPSAKWIAIAAVLLTGRSLVGQQTVEDDGRPAPATEIPSAGFWPTQTMMERIIDRMSDAMGEEYDFDENQIGLTADLFKRRVPAFLTQNRAEIQTLMNQFIEAQFLGEAPEADYVTEWSQRVLPLLHEFKDLITETTDEMREYMTDEQQNKLDAEFAAFGAGLSLISNKLNNWANGGYNPEIDWIPDGDRRRRRDREERRRALTEMEAAREAQLAAQIGQTVAEESTTTTAPAVPKDAWVIYVEDFIALYELNAEQRQKAQAVLVTQLTVRDRYLRSRKDDLQRVAKKLSEAETEEDRERAQAQYDKLNAPIERMLDQLKQRLDKIPTREQLRRAQDKRGPPDKATPASKPSSASSPAQVP